MMHEEREGVFLRNGKWVNNLPAPRPANLEEWSAAWNDPVEFAQQEAIYFAQLRESGFDMRGVGVAQEPPERFVPRATVPADDFGTISDYDVPPPDLPEPDPVYNLPIPEERRYRDD